MQLSSLFQKALSVVMSLRIILWNRVHLNTVLGIKIPILGFPSGKIQHYANFTSTSGFSPLKRCTLINASSLHCHIWKMSSFCGTAYFSITAARVTPSGILDLQQKGDGEGKRKKKRRNVSVEANEGWLDERAERRQGSSPWPRPLRGITKGPRK